VHHDMISLKREETRKKAGPVSLSARAVNFFPSNGFAHFVPPLGVEYSMGDQIGLLAGI
jgi:hypothetical protein